MLGSSFQQARSLLFEKHKMFAFFLAKKRTKMEKIELSEVAKISKINFAIFNPFCSKKGQSFYFFETFIASVKNALTSIKIG